MKKLILLAMLAACSDDKFEIDPELDKEIQRTNLKFKMIEHCTTFAQAVGSPDFLVASIKCKRETAQIEKAKKDFFAQIPKHLKSKAIYGGPQFSEHCWKNGFTPFGSPVTKEGGEAFRTCTDWIQGIEKEMRK